MSYSFFAAMSRMKYIERWALMRSTREENLCEHSMEVAMIAHALCTIGNTRYGRTLDADRAAVIGLFHDAPEIITGDMPTPVKYYDDEISSAYRHVERYAQLKLLRQLPDDLRDAYEGVLGGETDEAGFGADACRQENEAYMRRLVKAADKISALIKCIEEEKSGNTEFKTARQSTQEKISALTRELPEVKDFMEDFLPAYGRTLDELLQ